MENKLSFQVNKVKKRAISYIEPTELLHKKNIPKFDFSINKTTFLKTDNKNLQNIMLKIAKNGDYLGQLRFYPSIITNVLSSKIKQEILNKNKFNPKFEEKKIYTTKNKKESINKFFIEGEHYKYSHCFNKIQKSHSLPKFQKQTKKTKIKINNSYGKLPQNQIKTNFLTDRNKKNSNNKFLNDDFFKHNTILNCWEKEEKNNIKNNDTLNDIEDYINNVKI